MAEQAANLRQALWYRERLNWSVFPVHGWKDGACTCGNKACDRPAKHAVVKWEPYQKTLPTIEQVTADFTGKPWANIGLATGLVSSVVVLDVDQKGDGEQSLRDLQGAYGKLPDTVEALTGGGGRHIFFKHPGFEVRNRVRVVPGLDFRGDGGYVVLPRSTHMSGRVYEWEASSKPNEITIAEMPEWVVDLIRPEAQEVGKPGEGIDWAAVILTGAEEGTRNDTLTKLCGMMFRHGHHPSVVAAWMQLWNQANVKPPLSDDELLRTVKSIAQREMAQRMQRGRAG